MKSLEEMTIKERYRYRHREELREKARLYREANREKICKKNLQRYHDNMNYWKAMIGGMCWKCMSTENLEFDHIDPSTKCFEISGVYASLYSYTEDQMIEELRKCQLLCHKCHAKKTTVENRKLDPIQIRYIRKLYKSGKWTMSNIAERFKVDDSTISNIINRKTYSDVE